MSTIKVDNIEPFSGGQVNIQGLNISGYASTGSNEFIGDQTITGSLTISSSTEFDVDVTGRVKIQGGTTGATTPRLLVSSSDYNAVYGRFNTEYVGGTWVTQLQHATDPYLSFFKADFSEEIALVTSANFFGLTPVAPAILQWNGSGYTNTIQFSPASSWNNGLVTFNAPINISGSLQVSGTLDLTNTPITADKDITISNTSGSDYSYNYIYNMDSTQTAEFLINSFSSSVEQAAIQLVPFFAGINAGLGVIYAKGEKARVEAFDKTFEGSIGIYSDNTGGYIQDYSAITNDYSNAIKLQSYSNYNNGLIEILRNTNVTGSLNVSSSVSIGQALTLAPQDPLPSADTGSLAVSGSNLYYYNGTTWSQIN